MKKHPRHRILFTFLLYAILFQYFNVEAKDLNPGMLSVYGNWVGSWQGTNGPQGPKYELAIWINDKGIPATALIFDDCISIVYFEVNQDYWPKKYPVKYYNANGAERQTHKVFKLSSVIGSRQYKYNLDNSSCKPGSSKKFYFLVIGDQETRVMLINKDSQFKYADVLEKSDVSERMANAILKMQPFSRMTISAESKAALCDSSIQYLDQIKNKAAISKPCALYAIMDSGLASHSLGVWKENYHDLGELYFYVYNKKYDKAKKIDQYLTGFISFLDMYSNNCRNEMSGPKTEIVSTWSREVETKYGGRYTEYQGKSSYVVQNAYLGNYRKAYDYTQKNVWKYRNVPLHAWIPQVFLDNHGGCNSGEIKQMLDHYNEGMTEFFKK